jgi:hypothetical protein
MRFRRLVLVPVVMSPRRDGYRLVVGRALVARRCSAVVADRDGAAARGDSRPAPAAGHQQARARPLAPLSPVRTSEAPPPPPPPGPPKRGGKPTDSAPAPPGAPPPKPPVPAVGNAPSPPRPPTTIVSTVRGLTASVAVTCPPRPPCPPPPTPPAAPYRSNVADCTPAGTVNWHTPGWSKTTLVVGGSASASPPPSPPSAAQTASRQRAWSQTRTPRGELSAHRKRMSTRRRRPHRSDAAGSRGNGEGP